MKTNKVLAVALSAGLILGGASVANAAAGDKYESREAAAKEDLKNNELNNSYEITGEEDEWYYVLKFDQEKAITKEKEDSKNKEKSKEKSKPAKTKGNNPKTGLAGLAPIYSTLAISMAGIVAARKKND